MIGRVRRIPRGAREMPREAEAEVEVDWECEREEVEAEEDEEGPKGLDEECEMG